MLFLSGVEDVWEVVRDQVSVSREEFYSRVRSLKLLLGDALNDRAKAIDEARAVGISSIPGQLSSDSSIILDFSVTLIISFCPTWAIT